MLCTGPVNPRADREIREYKLSSYESAWLFKNPGDGPISSGPHWPATEQRSNGSVLTSKRKNEIPSRLAPEQGGPPTNVLPPQAN